MTTKKLLEKVLYAIADGKKVNKYSDQTERYMYLRFLTEQPYI